MKKLLVLFLTIAVMCMVFAGCNNTDKSDSTEATTSTMTDATQGTDSGNNTSVQEPVSFKYAIPGNKPRDYKMVNDEINKRLEADGMGIELERLYIPWDVWDQKINLMLATGEDFDMFHIMQDVTPYSNYIAKGALQDLTGTLEEYGDPIRSAVPESILKAAIVRGKTYVLPTFWIELAESGGFTARTDLLEKYNLPVPTNPDEFIEVQKKAMDMWEGPNKPYLNIRGGLGNQDFSYLHITYDTYPFAVKDNFFYVDQDANVKSWIETEEFKKDCEFMRKAYTEGIINPDVLTIKQEQVSAQRDNGEFILTGYADLDSIQKTNPDATADAIQIFSFEPDKPKFRQLTIKNCNGVPTSSDHPESAVKFLGWLWSNQDNYDLYFYGFEGVHFNKVGERGIEWINDPDNNNLPGYQDADWMSGNINFVRYDDINGCPAMNESWYTVVDDAINSVAASFIFDPSPVKTEWANITTEYQASLMPIILGVMEYDEAFPDALEKMKAAGIDTVVEEYKKQFNEWLAKQ